MTLIFISGFGIGCLFSTLCLWAFVRVIRTKQEQINKQFNEVTIQLMKERNDLDKERNDINAEYNKVFKQWMYPHKNILSDKEST